MTNIINMTQKFLYDHLCESGYDHNEVKYRYEHSLRVANIGLALSNLENANRKITVLGCLLPKFRTAYTTFINGIDIKNIENKSLRNHLVYMSQEVPIVTGTLKDNLSLGNKVSEEDINLV